MQPGSEPFSPPGSELHVFTQVKVSKRGAAPLYSFKYQPIRFIRMEEESQSPSINCVEKEEQDVNGLANIFYSHTLSHRLIDLKGPPSSGINFHFLPTGILTIFAPSRPDHMLLDCKM